MLVALAHTFVLSPTETIEDESDCVEGREREEADADGNGGGDGEDDVDEIDKVGVEAKEADEAAGVDAAMEDVSPIESVDESFDSLFSAVVERTPVEAKKLRASALSKKPLTRAERFDLAEMAVKRAFSECPSLELVSTALLEHPIYDLHKACRLVTGMPVHPMLAKPTKQITDVLRRLSGQAFTMEYKYDGERGQIHLQADGSVKIFSRNSEDNTEKYPDLMDVIRSAKVSEVQSCVVDAEVVAYDREKGCLLPFQVTAKYFFMNECCL